MMTSKEAEQTLSVIRTLMERGTRYTNLSGHAGIAAGCITLVGSVLRSDFHTPFLATWLSVLVATGGATVYCTARMARANGEPLWTRQARTVALAMAPAFTAAIVLTLALDRLNLETLLPGVWMLLWGVGALATSFFTPRVLTGLGLSFLAAGTLTLFSGLQNDALSMGLTFGAIHLLFGVGLVAMQSARGTNAAAYREDH